MQSTASSSSNSGGPTTTTTAAAKLAAVAETVAARGASDIELLSLLDEARTLPFFSLFSIDMLANCAYLDGAPEECEFDSCEIVPVEPTPRALFDRDARERAFELDAWARMDPPSFDYYDLAAYPEGYTGYDGAHVWRFAYDELAFFGRADDAGRTQRDDDDDDWRFVFDRALSGVHASISCHVADGLSDDDDARVAEAFDRRVASHPERLENLHFVFAVVLAAVREARAALAACDYDVEREDDHHDADADDADDATMSQALAATAGRAAELMHTLVELPLFRDLDAPLSTAALVLREAGSNANECVLAEANDKAYLEEAGIWQMRQRSRAVLRLFDCVACGVCRLHGKVCWYGVATALKLIYTDKLAKPLARVEVAALIVALEKLAASVRFAAEMTDAASASRSSSSTPPPPAENET